MPLGYIQLNNDWFHAHLTPSENEMMYYCVVLYSPEAVLEDIVSINVVVPLSRIQFETVKHFKKEKERRMSRGNLIADQNEGMFRDVSMKKIELELLGELDRLEALQEVREEQNHAKKRRNSHNELAVTEHTKHLIGDETLQDMHEDMAYELERLRNAQSNSNSNGGGSGRGNLLTQRNSKAFKNESLDIMQHEMASQLQQLKVSLSKTERKYLGHSNPDFHIEHDEPFTPASSLSTGSDYSDYDSDPEPDLDIMSPNSAHSDISDLDEE